ncbi:helix-turn-helix domain-containing protein [Carnobacterium maltaromaticum]|uniref:helix-turn-helix domain-containing protein n=1 Tax=Carnobacterium maltaromaticum TaxID=2751 RepID=UPI001EE244C7|nr:helix-turn-helix domain-containing protein [Carnobacterium maltaromaticum]
MQSILNSIDSRQISFIEVLFFQDDWITLGTIAEKLDCSEKILRSNINIINNIYAPFQITTSVKRGIRILYPENYNLDFVYSVTLGNSYEFNFLELVFFNESLKKGEMVESLFISPSSLNRIVKKCTAFFSQFGIEIRTSPYQMVGDELKIQNFYVHYFLEKYLLDSSPFEDKELGLINTILA